MNGRFWEHPTIRAEHLVRMERAYPDGVAHSVATCQCGWISIFPATEYAKQDAAIGAHWQRAIGERTEA